MKNDSQLKLFLVDNPVPFSRYEDHQAALHIQLYRLVEEAVWEGEKPTALIEDYLGVTYHSGETISEVANYILHTDQMQFALHLLRDNWQALDDNLPEDSKMYGGVSKAVARQIFSEIDLRTYLEALSGIIENS